MKGSNISYHQHYSGDWGGGQRVGREVSRTGKQCDIQRKTSGKDSSFKIKIILEAIPACRAPEHPIRLLWNLNSPVLYCHNLWGVWLLCWQPSGWQMYSVNTTKLNIRPCQASLVVSAWRLFISSLSSVALLKFPRRPLFLSTTLLVFLSMASLGVFSYFQVKLTTNRLF